MEKTREEKEAFENGERIKTVWNFLVDACCIETHYRFATKGKAMEKYKQLQISKPDCEVSLYEITHTRAAHGNHY